MADSTSHQEPDESWEEVADRYLLTTESCLFKHSPPSGSIGTKRSTRDAYPVTRACDGGG